MFRYQTVLSLLVAIALLSGCTIKTSIVPIDDGLKPKAALAGKVHLKPIIDAAQVRKQPDGYYTMITAAPDSRYVATVNPVEVVDESVAKCLTQAGMTVTRGKDVPADTDLVLESTVYRLYLDRHDPLWAVSTIVSAMTLTYTSSANPRAYLGVANRMSDPRNNSKTDAAFFDMDYSLHHFTEASGGARAFRLVQEKYCGWLQQKVVDFKKDPLEASVKNRAEMEEIVRTIKK